MLNREQHEKRRITEHWTTREGAGIMWADIDTRHLWNIARLLLRRMRYAWHDADKMQRYAESLGYRGIHPYTADIIKSARARQRSFCFVIDELDYRGVLPTQDALHVAWDRACAAGAVTDTHAPRCFVELWVAFRGEPTATPEYLASLKEAAQ